MFQLALSDFRRDGDDFGYYTTLCNQGHALSKEGKLDRALTVLNEAKEGLERLSKVNLHIIYNNLGLCYLLLNKYREAHRYLLLANQMSKNPMPRIFSSINIACTEALMGKKKEALSRLVSIEKEVADHTLDRVRQKYYIITPAIKHCRRGHWNHQVLDRVRESGGQSMTGRASGFVTVMS